MFVLLRVGLHTAEEAAKDIILKHAYITGIIGETADETRTNEVLSWGTVILQVGDPPK